MTRITEKDLETLTQAIARKTGKTYRVGRVFGLNQVLAEQINPQGAMRSVLSAPTKSGLYDLMHAYFAGLRDGGRHE
jgi:hypothetical protein